MAERELSSAARDILETGLLNNWYLVCRRSEVGRAPLSLKRLNQDIVLWRDQAGKVRAVEDYCPHRGAPLSLGFVHGGDITCAYHGVQLDGDGVITATPPTPDSPFVGKKCIKSYPVREAAGAVFLWFGDALHQEPPEMRLPEELASDDWSFFLYTATWKANYLVTLDNRLDPLHGSYLHGDTYTLSYGRKEAQLKIEDTENGFVVWRDNQYGVNIDRTWVVHTPGQNYWVTTEIPYPKASGGNMFRISGYPTPVDRDTTLFWVFRSQRNAGWRRDMWRFLYKNRLERRHNIVVDQDKVVLERTPLAARGRELLLQCDLGVARIRRIWRQEAERQARALAEASQQAAE
jgi:phenylpropionate dioxygenase-like ring-hydroxylating dioxygenase large terminal subunit